MHQLLRNVSSSIIALSLNVILSLSFLDVEDIYLPFVPVGNVSGTGSIELPEEDDDTSDAIITPPFPFGDSIQSTVFVRSQNGIFKTKIIIFLASGGHKWYTVLQFIIQSFLQYTAI